MADQFERVGLIAAVEGIEKYARDIRKIADGQDKVQDEFAETARESEKSAKKVTTDWNKVGRNMLIVSAAITAALAFGAKSAIDFESAMADVRKTVDEGEPGFQRLEDGINDMSRRLPIAREEIARTLAAAGQLGIEGVDNLLAFTEVAIGLGISTDLSAEQASFALAQLFNVTRLSEDQIENIGSVIVALGNNTATTESRILNFSQRIAASGTNAGLTTEEILALSATVLSLGVNTERGASQISNGFISIQKAVSEGGDELDEFARISGLSSRDFVRLWRDDALAAFELFITGLGTAGRDATDFLISVGLDGIRAVEVFQALGRAQGDLGTNIALANDASKENIALAEEVARRNATTASQIKIAWNEIKIAFGEAGETLLPVLLLAIDLLQMMLSVWDAIPEPIRVMAIAIGLVAVAFGVFSFAAIKAVGFVTAFSLANVEAALTVRLLGTSINLAIPIFGLFLAAVAAVTFGLISMGDAMDEVQARSQESAAITKWADAFDELNQNLTLVVDTSGEYLEILAKGEEAQEKINAGKAREVELTTDQLRAIGKLVDKGVEFKTAAVIIIEALEAEERALTGNIQSQGEAEQATARYTAALERGAEQSDFSAEQLGILTGQYLETEDATEELAEGTAVLTTELDAAREAAREAALELGRLNGRALALRIAADRISGANIDEAIFQFGGQAAADIIQAQNDALFDQLVIRIKLDDATATLADSLFEEAAAMAGVTEEANKLGGAAERISLAFDDAVESIERARAQMALGILIDELRAAGGNEEALALALLLASEAESGRQITSGIRAIADLFPEIGGAVNPSNLTEGGDTDRGVALLLRLLGGAVTSSLPSFQTGGLVTGDRAGAPLLAQLHVGEFVVPADAVQRLLGGAGAGSEGRGDVNFTANYFELESPVRVRDDLEALRLAGVF